MTARSAIHPLAKAAVTLALLGVMLSGCGRKADLDIPGVAPTPRQQANDKTPPKPEPPVEDRPFILDRLIK